MDRSVIDSTSWILGKSVITKVGSNYRVRIDNAPTVHILPIDELRALMSHVSSAREWYSLGPVTLSNGKVVNLTIADAEDTFELRLYDLNMGPHERFITMPLADVYLLISFLRA